MTPEPRRRTRPERQPERQPQRPLVRHDEAAGRDTTAEPDGSERPHAPRVRLVPMRLPGPIRGSRRRKEVVLRPARPQDAAACATLDGRYTTTHIWQLDTRQDADELRVSFRQVRLPRELALEAPHNPPAARAGNLPRGLCWLVAEEVEVPPADGSGPVAARARNRQVNEVRSSFQSRPEPVAPVPWSHAVRRGGRTSTVQLGFPSQPQTAERDTPPPPAASEDADEAMTTEAAPGTIVGYVVVAASGATAYLRTLVVDRKHRRKGVAGRLLTAAQRWAAGQGADGLMADAPARNYPALRLLQKAGFTFCGFNDRCYADGEVAVFFSCRLP